MTQSLQVLMKGLIDYAGLYPPASLDMPVAVRNYATYRSGPHAPWLGRFVVPVTRLDEFQTVAAGLAPTAGSPGEPWRVSALMGKDWDQDIAAIGHFHALESAEKAGKIRIDVVEAKADRGEDIAAAMAKLPAGITAYFEIPIQEDPARLLAALAVSGARAKVRTGGIQESQIPGAGYLARFLAACAKAGVSFKATAGLHHPLRAAYPLTYEPESDTAAMHGFLNLFLAAAFARTGTSAGEIEEMLEETSSQAFVFDARGVGWRARRLDNFRLRETREHFALSFGSCSFEEPVEDLRKLGLLGKEDRE